MQQTNIIDLGKVGITVEKNVWNSSTFYERLTMVHHKESGNTYVSVEDNVNRDPSKDDGSNWILASSNGMSIYELMVARGKYSGTEEQFLADYNKAVSDANAAAATATTATTAALAAADEANEAKVQAAAATELCENATEKAKEATNEAKSAAENAASIKEALDNFIEQGGGATDAQVIKNTGDIATLGSNVSELEGEINGAIHEVIDDGTTTYNSETIISSRVAARYPITDFNSKIRIELLSGYIANENLRVGLLGTPGNISTSNKIDVTYLVNDNVLVNDGVAEVNLIDYVDSKTSAGKPIEYISVYESSAVGTSSFRLRVTSIKGEGKGIVKQIEEINDEISNIKDNTRGLESNIQEVKNQINGNSIIAEGTKTFSGTETSTTDIIPVTDVSALGYKAGDTIRINVEGDNVVSQFRYQINKGSGVVFDYDGVSIVLTDNLNFIRVLCYADKITGAGNLHITVNDTSTDAIIPRLEALEEEVFTGKTDIISLNPKSIYADKISQLGKTFFPGGETAEGYKQLIISHFSDIHGNADALTRIIEWCGQYDTIADILHTGDTVSTRYEDGVTFWDNTIGADKVLNIVGNHDGWSKTGATITQEDVYNMLFKNKINNWGVTTGNKTYWYKDYNDCGIRLIGLDYLYDTDAQRVWLSNVLADAKSKNLAVICANHATPIDLNYIDCNFTSDFLKDEQSSGGRLFADDVDTFIKGGGEFICWMCGHTHVDRIGTLNKYPNQLCVDIDTATIRDKADKARIVGQKSQDLFNIVSFDVSEKIIRIVRVGAEYDRYARHSDVLCINYETKNIMR